MSKYFIEDGRVYRADVYEEVTAAELREQLEILKLHYAEVKSLVAVVDPPAAAPAVQSVPVQDPAPVAPAAPVQSIVQDVAPAASDMLRLQ